MNYTLRKFCQVKTFIFLKIQASLAPLIGESVQNKDIFSEFYDLKRKYPRTFIVCRPYLLSSTLLEKIVSANEKGIFAVTGRAHCQRQVAFFNTYGCNISIICFSLECFSRLKSKSV